MCIVCLLSGRRGGLIVSVLDSGANGPGSGPGREHCVGQYTLLPRCLSPPRCINGYRRNARGNPAMDWHPIQGEVEILLIASCHGNRDKLRPDGPLGSYADFTYPLPVEAVTSLFCW